MATATVERKSQFNPEEFEPVSDPGDPTDIAFDPANDAPLVPELESKDKPAKEPKPKKTDREKWEDGIRKEIKSLEGLVSEAALKELAAEIAHKNAKKAHKSLVGKMASLHDSLGNPQGHLPFEEDRHAPLPGQRELPLDGTPDEYGAMLMSDAKAWIDGKMKPLAKGFVEKCSELDPPVTTVSQLEQLIATGGIQKMKGVGESMVDKVSDWVMAYREEHPVPHPAEQPEATETTDAEAKAE